MKLCVVKLSAMGDIIHAMVVLQFIKKQRPDIQIDWVVENGFKGILENNPHIDNIFPVNLKSIKKKNIEINIYGRSEPLGVTYSKFKQIDLACPICKYPLGSGGKRVWTQFPFLP
mgnify:CR=1 FL=1